MTLDRLLASLRERGVQLWREGDQLRYRTDAETLTPELLGQLREQKPAILELLRSAEAPRQQQPSLQAIPRGGNLPLSFAQQRLWFLDQMEPNRALYNMPVALRLGGALNMPVLQRCLSEVLRRHEPLRTCFETVEGQPVQVIQPAASLEMPLVDLRSLADPERQAEAKRLCVAEAQRPFDLRHDLMLRVRLLRLGETEHILFLNMHHIASDGWSMGLLVRELKTLYEAFVDGMPSPLPELHVQYADFAAWQREWLQGDALKKQLGYWRKQLEGAPALLELPTDRPRPATQSYRGALMPWELAKPLSIALGELSQRENATLFMTLLAAFQTLLHRYTSSEEILVGSPIAGRTRTEFEPMIGCFVNTLVLRGDLSVNPSFRTLLGRTREAALGAYAHQDLPFERLVEELHPERDLSHSPLFQVMFVLQNAPWEPAQLAGLEVTPMLIDSGTSKFDVTLFVREREGALQAVVEYNTDLFKAETIRRMLSHYQTLLEGIVANPDQRLLDLPLLTDAERHQLLVDWNQTQQDYPRNKCVHELFEEQADRTPDAVAVVFEDTQLTYRQLNERANQLARYLQGLGVGPDRLVGICVERSLEMVVGLLGILKAGGAYVPLDPAYPKDRIAFMMEDTKAPVVLTQQSLVDNVREHSVRVICLDTGWREIDECSKENPACISAAENSAYVVYTSGSTGSPKGTTIPHRGMLRLLCGTDFARLDQSRIFLQLAPISFDASTLEIWGPLLHGARCVLFPGRVPLLEDLGRVLKEQHITTLWLTSSLFNAVIDQAPQTLSSLDELLIGGEALSVAHVRRGLELLPNTQIINGYGPTESTTFTCCYRIPRELDTNLPSVPIGRPIANTLVYILDERLKPVPVGVAGELFIGGDGLARGYLNQPELTAEKFIPDPFSTEPGGRLYRTGDVVRYLSDGNIEFLGRLDHQVKIRGFRIELGEIESVLAGLPGVREAVVVTREDVSGDKRLVAYLTAKEGKLPQNSELRGLLQAKLPEYMVPSAFVTLDRFPLTPNGKVDRNALPQPDQARATTGFVPPRTPTEVGLATIWGEVLGLKQVGIHDNFFELGGHSLLAIRLISEINRVLMVALPVRALFQHPTIEELAKALPTQQTKDRESKLILLRSGNAGHDLFFLIDEGSLGMFKLAHFLGEGLSLYASVVPFAESVLRASMDKQFSALPKLEQLAAEHAALIGSQHTTRPLVLAGHCFGGILAFEAAHQLQRAGKHVEAVLLLDTWMTEPMFWWPKKAWLRAHFRNLLKQGPLYLWRKGRRRVRLEKDELALRLKLAKNGDFSLHAPWNIIERIYRHARRSYRPQMLASRGILFVSHEDWRSNAFRERDNSLGTSRFFAGGVEVLDVPGDHVTVLDEPNLPQLARRYEEGLKRLRIKPIRS
jgi:aspartate racemase